MFHASLWRRPSVIGGLLAVMVAAGVGVSLSFRSAPSDRADTNPPTDSGRPLAPKEQEPVKPSAADQGLGIDWAGLPVAEEQSAVVAATGVQLALADGTKLDLPAGAAPSGTKVVLRRRTPEPDGPAVGVTQVEAGEVELTADAILTVPIPPVPRALAGRPVRTRAVHIHSGKPTEMEVTPAPSGKAVQIRLRRFSEDVFFNDGDPGWTPGQPQADRSGYREWAAQAFRAPRNPPLKVPFYSQGQAGWCWAACLQSMLKSYGVDEEIWTLARRNNSGFQERLLKGLSPTAPGLGIFTGQMMAGIRSYFPSYLQVEHFRVPWMNHRELAVYLADRLREGRPVLLSTSGHIVVAVGFDQEGLLVHDPSGNITESADKEAGRPIKYADSTHTAALKIGWDDFFRVCGASSYGAGAVWTLCVRNRDMSASPVTMTLFPNELTFWHPMPDPPRGVKFPNVYFAWDGTVGPGYRFCRYCAEISQEDYNPVAHECKEDSHANLVPLNATNSDKVRLAVAMSNASADRAAGRLYASIGGRELVPAGSPFSLGGGGPPYETIKTFVVADGVELARLGLPPGRHEMKIHAKVGDTQVADSIGLVVDLGPSQVKGVAFAPAENNKRMLRWMPVAEFASGIEYEVYSLEGDPPVFVKQAPVPVTSTRSTEVAVNPTGPNDRRWFSVTARHIASGVRGCPSTYIPSAPPAAGAPTNLKSRRVGIVTYVDFDVDPSTVGEGETAIFRLQSAEALDGPWTLAQQTAVTRFEGKLHWSSGSKQESGDRPRPSMDDRSHKRDERLGPAYYRVARDLERTTPLVPGASPLLRPPTGNEKEVYSEVLAPPMQMKWELNASGAVKNTAVSDGETIVIRPEAGNSSWTDLYTDFGVGMSLVDQYMTFPGARYDVTVNGKTRYCWSPRREGGRSYELYGQTGRDSGMMGRVRLPLAYGSSTVTVNGSGAFVGKGSATVTLVFNPPNADTRRAAAARNIDDDESVRSWNQYTDNAPARLASLQSRLDKEKDEGRKQELREGILELENSVLQQEETRVKALSGLIAANGGACRWDRALELALIRLKVQAEFRTRYKAFLDKCIAWKLRGIDEPYRDRTDQFYFGEGLRHFRETIDIARMAGDYDTVLMCATRVLDEIPTVPPGLRQEFSSRDVGLMYERLANDTATLTGDRTAAAGYWIRGRVGGPRPVWWPMGDKEIPPAGDLRPAERKRLYDDFNRRVADIAKALGISVPGMPR